MKLSERAIFKFCYQNWYKPFNSPFGNSNYHRDTRKKDPSRWNRSDIYRQDLEQHLWSLNLFLPLRSTDPVVKIKFHEDINKFSRFIK